MKNKIILIIFYSEPEWYILFNGFTNFWLILFNGLNKMVFFC